MELCNLNLTPTYDDIHLVSVDIGCNPAVHDLGIERIIGISRGGLLPAIIISNELNIPMTPIAYSSKSGKGNNKNHTNVLPDIAERVLYFVEDIIDSGFTMREIIYHYQSLGKTCYSFALYTKETAKEVFIPTFHWIKIPPDVKDWVVFPFEKNDTE